MMAKIINDAIALIVYDIVNFWTITPLTCSRKRNFLTYILAWHVTFDVTTLESMKYILCKWRAAVEVQTSCQTWLFSSQASSQRCRWCWRIEEDECLDRELCHTSAAHYTHAHIPSLPTGHFCSYTTTGHTPCTTSSDANAAVSTGWTECTPMILTRNIQPHQRLNSDTYQYLFWHRVHHFTAILEGHKCIPATNKTDTVPVQVAGIISNEINSQEASLQKIIHLYQIN